MGKPRPAAPDAAQQLREATAEAHAAIKDLRAAIREARQLPATLDEASAAAAAAHAEVLNGLLSTASAELTALINTTLRHLQGQADKVADHTAALLGAGSTRALLDVVVEETVRSLSAQLMLEATENGAVLVRKPDADEQHIGGGDLKQHLRRDRATGQIFVTTDPALARHR